MQKTNSHSENTSHHSDDEELLSLYCQGNNQAFETLYKRHRDSLYRFILRHNNNLTAVSEEIFQEVWISVIKNRHQFKNKSKFSGWLYQISRNKLIDHGRKSTSRKEKLHHSSEDELIDATEPQPDKQTQLELCIELLHKFVLQLPVEQKQAFVLKHDTDQSIEELCLITNTSQETFKSRLRYAMKKLRDWLPGECL